jgi:hypothetical protein
MLPPPPDFVQSVAHMAPALHSLLAEHEQTGTSALTGKTASELTE